MTGTKGRSGGPRLGNPNKKRGICDRSKARKSGALMQNLHISKSAARMLRILLFNRQSLGGDIDENGLVESLIEEKWIEYDQAVQKTIEDLGRYDDVD